MTRPRMFVNITSPAAGVLVTHTVTVTGNVGFDDGGDKRVTLLGMVVGIRLGDSDTSHWVTIQQNGLWQFTGTVPANVSDGSQLQIEATATGSYEINGNEPEFDADPDTADVTVQVKPRPAELTVVQDYPVEIIPSSLPFAVMIHGTTTGALSNITEVRLALDGAAGVLAHNVTPPGDWSSWEFPLSLPAGDHQFVVTARDARGNQVSSLPGRILVHQPFEETDPAIVFGPTIYVRELCDFAGQYVAVAGRGTGPDRALLAARFRQPYDRLPDIQSYAVATAPVDQRRVAIEVLRRYLTSPVPADTEQRLRRLAYESLLRELGTSTVELRQARVADGRQRTGLAQRLGIDPDHLDDLTVSPDEITDAQLESLFGFRSMQRTDPLQPAGAQPSVLAWRQAALRGRWRLEDIVDRDGRSGPLPVIDPDHVQAANLASQQTGDLAHDLWAARQALIQSLASQIDHAVAQGPTAATFDQLVTAHVGAIDLAALTARDGAGEDITGVLRPLQLGLGAFRYLVGARSLLTQGGGLLTSEWVDVRDVLVQVHKLRLFPTWRQEERAADIVLEPQQFLVDPAASDAATPSRWRTDRQVHQEWQRTLTVRAAQLDELRSDLQAVVQAAEAAVLPVARDELIALIGSRHAPAETADAATERLTRELCIDLRAASTVLTTRADQAAQTLLDALIALRSGRLPAGTDGQAWTVVAGREPLFDREWAWMGSYATWYAAITAFAYPDNQLFPGLYVAESAPRVPSDSYHRFLDGLRRERVNRSSARDLAQQNWNRVLPTLSAALRGALTNPANPLPLTGDHITELHTAAQLDAVRTTLLPLYDVAENQQPLRELFWLVPVALGLALTDAGDFTAALDWYQYAYAYQLPPASRRVFPGLVVEKDIKSTFGRAPTWPADDTNPHEVALERANAYTRFTIICIVRCLLAYADNEFVRNTAESDARARALYETALDLITSPDAAPEIGNGPFPANPVLGSLETQARTGLDKIHKGLNISSTVRATDESVLPSQYRYAVLADRARNLVASAAQLESAFLAAAEQADAGTYSALQANRDLQVAGAVLAENDLKVESARTGVELATKQRERSIIDANHYIELLGAGLNIHEVRQLNDLEAARDIETAGGIFSGIASIFNSSFAGGAFGGLSGSMSLDAQLEATKASFERREQEWQLHSRLSVQDVAIGTDQIALAEAQKGIAVQERDIANLQLTFATATANFVATKFTSAELFDWMSGVLNQVYAYFLRQATAVARLAQAQLAFERQEPNRGLIRDDYWQGPPDPNTVQADATDRRGLTGSARLLQDLTRLDEYAFETNRRKLHLTQTFSLAQLTGTEMQQLRETGVMTFGTPEVLFDRRFPGHYLRLVNAAKISVIALVPPVTGVSATLSTSGVSRTVVARDTFRTVTLRRDPESIAFTSPVNATGRFELEPDNGMLRPFEGMGVDAVWRLEIPKAANQFDYRTIADVLFTLEYTALASEEYRHAVIRSLDRQFSGDRTFSIREQFPDTWYALNNPDTVDDPARRMHATLSLTRDDFPPQLEDLAVAQVTLFALRDDTLLDEVTVPAARHIVNGQTTAAGPVTTAGGIAGTRRANGVPWLAFVGSDPTGDWDLKFDDTPTVRAHFANGLIQDVVLVLTIAGTTPAWP